MVGTRNSGIFDLVESMGHEQVVFCHDKATGLKAIIGIHDTTLGPALGGTRLWDYASDEDALVDVLRLSRGIKIDPRKGCPPRQGDTKIEEVRMFRRTGPQHRVGIDHGIGF